MNDDELAYQVQMHAADDNSTYERELLRTQIFMVRESGKEAQILCARFENAAWRAVARASSSMILVVVSMILIWHMT